MKYNEKRHWAQKACDSDSEREAVKAFLTVTEPIHSLLRRVNSGQAFVGKKFHHMYRAQQAINQAQNEGKVPEDVAEQVTHILEKLWDYLHRPVMSVGYMLDPEFIDVNPYAYDTVQTDFDKAASQMLQSTEENSAEERKQMALRQYQVMYKKMACSELIGS